jgi:hypothetical protein
MLSKERNDRFQEIRMSRNQVVAEVLPVIVVPPVDEDSANSKEALKLLETAQTLHPLRHGKTRSDLIPGSVASPVSPVWLPDETDGEASFPVYKTGNPSELNQPFLLVSCTGHIVTVPPP